MLNTKYAGKAPRIDHSSNVLVYNTLECQKMITITIEPRPRTCKDSSRAVLKTKRQRISQTWYHRVAELLRTSPFSHTKGTVSSPARSSFAGQWVRLPPANNLHNREQQGPTCLREQNWQCKKTRVSRSWRCDEWTFARNLFVSRRWIERRPMTSRKPVRSCNTNRYHRSRDDSDDSTSNAGYRPSRFSKRSTAMNRNASLSLPYISQDDQTVDKDAQIEREPPRRFTEFG